jgi:HK97 family phage portal protein
MDLLQAFTGRIRSYANLLLGNSSIDNPAHMSAFRAIKYAPVWYAINKIAGHVSQLPLVGHRRLDRGSERAPDLPAYRLLKRSPNRLQTASVWKEQGMSHALLWGNWRSAIVRRGSRPVELIPLLPDRTDTGLIKGEKWHVTMIDRDERLSLYRDMEQHPEKQIWLPDDDVFHVPGFGFDGINGMSLFKVAADSWDAGLSAEGQVRSLAKKGFSGSLILESPSGMFRDEKEAKRFLDFFRSQHDGEENTGKTAMLREGIKANMVAMSGRDSQWIEQRLFQRQEAALWFLLEEIVGDDSSVSYNSLAEKHLAYLTNCLNKWLVKIEQECDNKLLTESQKDRDSHYFKFNTSALMRMDDSKTAEYLSKMVASQIYSPNEAREKLDMNPYEGGDEYVNPAINVKTAVQPEESGEDTPAAASRAAVVSRLRHLIGIEQQRIGQACKAKNFLASVDKFYDKWRESLAAVCEELGGDRDVAVNHCQQSQDALLELTTVTTPVGLSDAVGELTATWADRAEGLADELLGATVNV